LIVRVFKLIRKVFLVYIIIVIVKIVLGAAEASGASGSPAYGALRSALEFGGALRLLAPASWERVWAKVPLLPEARCL
jgi:hypothetical protein